MSYRRQINFCLHDYVSKGSKRVGMMNRFMAIHEKLGSQYYLDTLDTLMKEHKKGNITNKMPAVDWGEKAAEYHSQAGFYKSCIESWLVFLKDPGAKSSYDQLFSLQGAMSEALKR